MAEKSGFAFRNLSVAWKLRCMAVVTCVLLLVMGAFGVYQLSQAQDRLQEMYKTNLEGTKALDNTAASFLQLRLAVRTVAMAQNAADTQTATGQVQDAFGTLDDNWKTVIGINLSGDDRDRDTLTQAFSSFRSI